MRLEKIVENQTRNTYEIQIALMAGETIYGNITGSIIQNPLSGDLVRVKLYVFGRLIEDTFERKDITLDNLISRALKDNNIEIDDD